MAEDIDIEEHDLLQNPMLQRIFPDMSILKQEILDYEDGVMDLDEGIYDRIYKEILYLNSLVIKAGLLILV